ncbi:hypothetical protein I307_02953 [Cryptococcus deuterogattii 99/473]|uniref:Ribosome biogenesis protein NSA1 n=1 Tax=Cryptococcus deuterogattii Ram5 TaxID=1296110 RepID=A0A0D0UVQ8_9TREE|nr:hypothetical protein I309_02373 [Cryptococcus deuterogattii LA55]KIR39301.1 hypothetical protein I313_04902 [Cryptococcus deuterogattii Ram5]KIR94723.1 hypothetical protein I304_01042 [Cryptococcus deuterogattii CBS 10090]KIS00752.1 hypothetical protein L804_02173 [Cryptococcus deuterogattii 2001/935-1]KIY57461.1 hypothetical protein I307_02953 [Cryptococcus deuterogattii 99/473]
MTRTYNFLAPSLYPNTLVDISFPEPTIGVVNVSPADPVIHHLPVKYGEHNALGGVRKMVDLGDNKAVVADDKFQISTLELSSIGTEIPSPPIITSQESVKARSNDVWAGLVPVEKYDLSPGSSSSSRSVSSPLACLASTSFAPNQFALGGKEVDVSIWDVERTFASSSDSPIVDAGKRKKNAPEPGQIWQAKNMPNNYLKLRPPVHHLALSWLNSPDALVSGTKMGTVRRFDTRQRKPVADWKVAREGGVACLIPGEENELFFSDRSNYLGALDLRTGKVLYSYSSLTATPHHLLAISSETSSPLPPRTKRIGFASISSDASIRLHTCTTPPPQDQKGNWASEGKKGDIVGMVGGIGLGGAIFRGYGERELEIRKEVKEDGVGEDESDDEEEIWEGMDEVEDAGEGSGSDEGDYDSDEDAPKKKSKRSRL